MIRGPSSPEVFADRYEILELAGAGMHGTVHRALDLVTGETVALKRWFGQATAQTQAELLVDARTIARLAGPGIVAYRSVGVRDDAVFVATEWVPGGRLSDRLARGALSVREALDLAKRIAWGLARLHQAGLAHRNLKPVNVLLPEGATWCAKMAEVWIETHEPVRVRYHERYLVDFVGFLSPQVIRRGHLAGGPRDDVYSLGAILFRCLTGTMPFPEHDRPSADSMLLPASRAPRRLAGGGYTLPEELVDVTRRMLSHDPAERPADAVEPCRILFEAARAYGSYDQISAADMAPDQADLPPHFEVRKGAVPRIAPAPERDIEVDPEALRGPHVILERPLDAAIEPTPWDVRLHPGEVFAGRFEIEEIAGAGKTGLVYRAKDQETRDTVALRVLDGAPTRREVKRLLAASAKHAQRYHPRIVRVLHRGVASGRMFVAMDWISGETLAQRLARAPLAMKDAVTVLRGLIEGLELVHTMGLVQGNLRPENVFLRNRNVEWAKLSDIAVFREEDRLPDTPMEELVYVAPEVARKGQWSARADVYALGVIAYRMLTGVLPFEAASAEELATKRWAPAPPLREMRPDANDALCRLVDGLLSRDPSKRPHDAIVVAGWLSNRSDLGWGADHAPLPFTQAEDGRRTAVMPGPAPRDAATDERFQAYLLSELQSRSDSAAAHQRLSDIVHGRAGAKGDVPGCALCGRGPALGRTLIEVRDGRYFPVDRDEWRRVAPPAICAGCLVDPHESVDVAVRRTLESLRGDDARPVGTLGPTRREVREAIEALHRRAVPRMGEGTCSVCRGTGTVLVGHATSMCRTCLSAARGTHASWAAQAPARREMKRRRTLDDLYRAAFVKVTGRAPGAGAEAYPVFDTRVRPHPVDLYRMLKSLQETERPAQAQVDEVARALAATILTDVEEALTCEEDVAAWRPRAGHWEVPNQIGEYRQRFTPSRDAGERLLVAMEVLAEARRRGADMYPQDSGIETIGG